MKVFAFLFIAVISFSASAVKFQKVSCLTQNKSVVQVTFVRAIEALNPFIGAYDFGAELEVQSAKGIYTRKDLRISPLKTYHDPELRGDAGGAVYLRLAPVLVEGAFEEHYSGQLFVNDLDARAYFNFKDTNSQPGLVCTVQ